MKTTKPISTISFNTVDFLIQQLETLVSSKKISFWAFVPHKPEDDEAGNKPHIHLYMEPSKLMQTDDLKDIFKELDLTNINKKPLNIIAVKPSKFEDWFLYGCHDSDYLYSKNQTRKHHYDYTDFASSDNDEFVFRFKSIDKSRLSTYSKMKEYYDMGFTFTDFAIQNSVPVQQFNSYKNAWETMVNEKIYMTQREMIENDIASVRKEMELFKKRYKHEGEEDEEDSSG